MQAQVARLRDAHRYADLFPMLQEADLEALAADIKKCGLLEPIVTYQGKILDGRNRYQACLRAEVDPSIIAFDGDDSAALGLVVSKNLKRRHLDESQRAMVAAKVTTMRRGARTDIAPIGAKSDAQAAALLNVSERSVERAKTVQRTAAPELIEAVERGTVSVSAAAEVASLPITEQAEVVARGEKAIVKAAKEILARQTAERRAEWTARTLEISRRPAPWPLGCLFTVGLADPPWSWEAYGADSGMQRAAGAHYPTMSLDAICALPVGDLFTPDAVLFLWTTGPHLVDALTVLDRWGFTYVTNFTWEKDSIGLGYWVRNQHETLLVAKRGQMRCPPPDRRPPSVIHAPRREHSEKPDEVYALIEHMYPELPRIELFARRRRPGWTAWGNEIVPEAA